MDKLQRPHCDLIGMMVSKGNHPQMALSEAGELLLFTQIYVYTNMSAGQGSYTIDACTRITVDPTDGIAKKNSVQPSLYVNLCTETISVYIHVTITTKLLNLHVFLCPSMELKKWVYHQMWLDKMPLCNYPIVQRRLSEKVMGKSWAICSARSSHLTGEISMQWLQQSTN